MVAQKTDRLLLDQVASRIRELTYGRIRDLAVVEEQGKVVVRGQVPSHHVRQLALQGALELLPGDACRPCITVAS
jgi:osmotically-inducible protein OsmY